MKELTTQEKAKLYDEAIEIINDYYQKIKYSSLSNASTDREVLEKAFPQLKESGDEKIRNEIYSALKYLETELGWDAVGDVDILDAYAWLEKQGEQKHVEPKFKAGDKIRKKVPRSFDKDMEVARIDKGYYICNHIGKFSSEVVPFSEESSYDLIEQKPAWGEEDENMYSRIYNLIHEAAFANYDVDEDGKELGEYAKITGWFKSLKERVQPQPKREWSEEDENMLQSIIATCELAEQDRDSSPARHLFEIQTNWLKSLKDRVQPQSKQEWSDEDYNEIETIACHLDNIDNEGMAEVLRNIRDKYCHIIPQTIWKPSDAQMKRLKEACDENYEIDGLDPLYTLYEQLKQL